VTGETQIPPTQSAAPTVTLDLGQPPISDPSDSNPDSTALPTSQKENVFPPEVGSTQPGLACLGTSDGITCLDENGWQSFTTDNSPLGSDLVYDIRSCNDTSLIIAESSGASLFNGETWQTIELEGYNSPETAICDQQGRIWVAHYKGVSYWEGQNWITYPSTDLAFGEAANDLVRDIAVTLDGKVWVLTANSVAVLENDDWTIFQEGNGFAKKHFFQNITVDGGGNPWVAHSSGLMHHDGIGWILNENSDLSSPQALRIDVDGSILIGTLTKGMFIFNTGNWLVDNQSANLSSNTINAIATDSQGRLWVATEWGLDIYNGSTWRAFRMDNADLLDNDITAVGVLNAGPPLPQPLKKELGSMSGKIVDEDGNPLGNSAIQICVESLGSMYFGETPCDGQPFLRNAIADEIGQFEFSQLPAGYYVITINTGDGWSHLTNEYGFVSERVLIIPGENTYIGEVIIGEVDE
jgi:hypothetical protein